MPVLVVVLLALPADPTAVRAAVSNAVPPLVAAATGHADQKTCFACHNQAVPAVALDIARSRGFPVPAGLFAEQAEHITTFIGANQTAFATGRGTGGAVDTAGYALFTLDRLGHAGDDQTAAVVEYLLQHQAEWPAFRTTSRRPPTEASDFTVNYLAAHALNRWATADQQARAARRLAEIRGWLRRSKPADTEDRVFHLLALAETGLPVETAAKELLADQRSDGGWGQRPGMPSDAYATGTVLFALHTTGHVPTTDPRYRVGVGFLVRNQRSDGTWFVKSRSSPFQPYYESGFPHGKDQFISAAASGWATAALALACEPLK